MSTVPSVLMLIGIFFPMILAGADEAWLWITRERKEQ